MRLDDPRYWKDFRERHRVRICQAGGAVLFLIAKPRSNALFLLGFLTALAGEALRFWAAGHIRKGEELAQDGPYAMTRNPLYLGSFVMACGFALICTAWRGHRLSTLAVWAAVLAAFYRLYPEKIALEEADLEARFGARFEDYRRRVPRFWPDPRRWKEALRTTRWDFRQALKNKEQKTLWALLGLALLLRFKLAYRF